MLKSTLWHADLVKNTFGNRMTNENFMPKNNFESGFCFIPGLFGPHHEKTCFSHMRTTKVQVSLHIGAV